MNQNSNIRRIDELGRIVIPKDIRKKIHLMDNEPLEIFIENDEIKIKKYSALPDVIDYIKYLVDLGNRITKNEYIITDRTNIIAASNKEYIGLTLTPIIESYVLSAANIKGEYITLELSNSISINAYVNLIPILIDNDRSGIIIEYNVEKKLESENVIKILKNIIERKLNNC